MSSSNISEKKSELNHLVTKISSQKSDINRQKMDIQNMEKELIDAKKDLIDLEEKLRTDEALKIHLEGEITLLSHQAGLSHH